MRLSIGLEHPEDGQRPHPHLESRRVCGDLGCPIARLNLLLVCLTSAMAAWGQGRVHLTPTTTSRGGTWSPTSTAAWSAWATGPATSSYDPGRQHVGRGPHLRGYSTSALDVAYTLRDNKLYLGDSSFSDAILYTFDEAQIFMGDSRFLGRCHTFREEQRRLRAATTRLCRASTRKTAARGATVGGDRRST